MSLILSGTDGLSDVDGSAATPAIRGTDTNTGIFFPAADTIAFAEGGAECARFDSSGNLLVGGTTGTSTTTPIRISSGGTYGTTYANGTKFVAYDDGGTTRHGMGVISGVLYLNANDASTVIGLCTNNTERARIDGTNGLQVGTSAGNSGANGIHATGVIMQGASGLSQAQLVISGGNTIQPQTLGVGYENLRLNPLGGNVLVGRTSVYSSNAERLSVQATGNSPAILAINAAGATDYNYVGWNSATTGDNKFVGFFTETSPSLRGSIDYNRAGGVTRYNTSSDATLKNINGDAPKQISIDILNSTKIREYSWKDDATNKVQIGVIAQELHETFKGAVSVGGDKVTTDAEGNETTEYVPWAVDKTAFTFHLVAGWQEHERIIQEQQAIITQLTERITALEGA